MVHNVIAAFMKWATDPDTVQQVIDGTDLDYDKLAGYKMSISRVTAALEGIKATGSIDGFTTQPSTWTDSTSTNNNKRKHDQVDVDLTNGGTPGGRPPNNQQQRQQQQQVAGGGRPRQERRNSNNSQRTPPPFAGGPPQGDIYNANGRSYTTMPQCPLASGKKPCIKWHDIAKHCDKSAEECEYDHTPYSQLIDSDKEIFDEFLSNNDGVYLRQRSSVRQPHFGGTNNRVTSPRAVPSSTIHQTRNTTRSSGGSTDETTTRHPTG